MVLFPDEVYVFTPRGDVKAFPTGATPIDFAYSVHTDIGTHCVGAKVNRNIVPLKYKLQNGDTVDIITQPNHHPSKDWLKYAVTPRAISKIKQWIKTEEREKSIDIGRDILDREFKKNQLKYNQVIKSDIFREILSEQSLPSVDDLLALIGYGKISARYIVNRFLPEEEKEDAVLEKTKKKTKKTLDTGISITGIDDVMVRFARCCTPLPGDDIIGYITRGRGVSVHVATCAVVQGLDLDRLVDVQWSIENKQAFPVNIRVVCADKKGLLSELSSVIANLGINISAAYVDTIRGENATFDFELDVHDLDQFNKLVSELRRLKNVVSIERVRGPAPVSKKNHMKRHVDY
jgi:guanosine-3',5'-bis(diphosphate) 3'-pyrophosphohydrolase